MLNPQQQDNILGALYQARAEIHSLRNQLAVANAKVQTMDLFRIALCAQIPGGGPMMADTTMSDVEKAIFTLEAAAAEAAERKATEDAQAKADEVELKPVSERPGILATDA